MMMDAIVSSIAALDGPSPESAEIARPRVARRPTGSARKRTFPQAARLTAEASLSCCPHGDS